MRHLLFIVSAIAFMTGCDNSSDSSSVKADTTLTKKDTMVYGEMKKYWLVFLKSGPNRTQDSIAAARIQAGHIANIKRLAKEGVIVMAGPMGDKTELKGIFIMNCKDSMEAVNYVRSDTAIITGRLIYEIHPWWTAQGKYVFN